MTQRFAPRGGCRLIGVVVVAMCAALGMTCSSGVAAQAAPAKTHAQVLPRPTSWTPGNGSFQITGATLLMQPDQANLVSVATAQPVVRQQVTEVLATFASDMRAMRGVNLPIKPANSGPRHSISFTLTTDATLGTEGYRMSIRPSGIQVSAQTSAGLFYATRSLEQMVASTGQIQAGQMTDVPGIGQRFVYLDAGRKYFSIDYLKDLIRHMAQVKLNTLQLHLAEAEGFRLYSPKYPGLTDPSVSYTQAQIKDLVEFARRLQVDVVPGFEFPGHATVVSEYFNVGMGDGANPCTPAQMHSHLTPNWVIDYTSPAGRAASTDLLQTFLPWFTSPYVHLGGDELPSQLGNCGRIQNYIGANPDVQNFGDTLVKYVNGLDSTVRQLGKTAIIFNGFEAMNPQSQTLNKDITIMDWEGEGTNPAFAGHQILTSNSDYAYLTPNNYHNKIPNLTYIDQDWSITAGDRAGAGLSVWADYNMWAQDQFFEQQMAIPRVVMADRLWNTAKPVGGADAIVGLAKELPNPPGYQGFAPMQRVGASQPRYHYTFENAQYPPGYHWAGSPGNTIMLADSTGRLSGSSYILWNPVPVADGVKGQAWQFNDNNSGVGLGGVDIAPPWTFDVWVKPSAWVANAVLMSSFYGQIRLVNGAIVLVDASGHQSTLSTGSLPLNQWTNLAVVASPNSTVLYVNGAATSNVPTAIGMPMKAIGDVRGNPMYRGQLDEMSIYDAALNPQQVAALVDSSRTKPVVRHDWPLSEGRGTTVTDQVTGATATIDGAHWITDAAHGTALAFDGVNDGIDLGAQPLSGSWAATMWVKRTGDATSAALFSDMDSSAAVAGHSVRPGTDGGQ